ncbi:MAG TPA: peptidoglycan DD-metalloendopeptidase family protein [Geminicoccus sp.]|jgi:murein DD-endopeptidase MepM/ murein hydrolase activator NlpD|uniref:M23 family metallopeptidase n=1 Tax=Geminicoccus sp. TaxID=2024832 RepID=UPI002E34E8D2|nr:peptidoglycan DD-metalloendopeptidase family protein [Geminicoccus sp.]HEX2527496.1 peptidoglycan DD-metalloendopeptidase family protein [Geminicoccus sp.]
MTRRSKAGRQILLGTVAAAASIAVVGLGAWSWQLKGELGQRDLELRRLAAENIELERARDEAQELQATLVSLDSTREVQRSTIGRLIKLHSTTSSELSTLREQLADADRRRLQAMAVVDRLMAERKQPGGMEPVDLRPSEDEVERLTAALDRALADRTATELEAKALHAKTASLEATIDGLNQELDATKEHFQAWVSEHYGALRAVLKSSGVRVEPLVQQAKEKLDAEGGPFVPAPLRDDRAALSTLVPLPPELGVDVRAVDALRQLLTALPLGVPVVDAETRSGFGLRRDPFTRRRAMHTGLDFTPGSLGKAFAAGPGVVVWAAREGAYGKLVEIDHGFGLTTRYAHLSRIDVRPGDHAAAGQEIGVIGSTGRSTGRHLHYEIRVDGKAVDPADFLEARKRLANVLSEE